MKSVRLDTLRADARRYADQRTNDEANDFLTADDYNRLINKQLDKLYDKLVAAAGPEYYSTASTLSISQASGATYSLPSDFYQLLAVNLEWEADDVEPVQRLNSVADIWRYQNDAVTWDRWTRKAYRLHGASITFYPTPAASVTARVYYIPARADLVADDDTFDGVNGWDDAAALGAAMAALDIEEEGTGMRWKDQYDEAVEAIEAMADDRDANEELQVRDVLSGRRRYWYPPARSSE